jgi:ABC-2 type transport system permease protein
MRIFTQKNYSILRELITTDFKVRYQGSVLGYLWSFLRPLFLFFILYIVFTHVFKLGKSIPHYPVYLLLGIVLWNFFTESTSNAMTSIVVRGELIKKISIARYSLVLSSISSALINLIFNLFIIFAIAFISNVSITLGWLMLAPLVLELILLAMGLGFLLSTLFVVFRDLTYIWEVILQAAFYLTPIIYPVALVNNKLLEKIIMLNPVAQIIQDARYFIVTKHTTTGWSVLSGYSEIIPIFLIVLILIFGGLYFKRESKYFAERI